MGMLNAGSWLSTLRYISYDTFRSLENGKRQVSLSPTKAFIHPVGFVVSDAHIEEIETQNPKLIRFLLSLPRSLCCTYASFLL